MRVLTRMTVKAAVKTVNQVFEVRRIQSFRNIDKYPDESTNTTIKVWL